MSETKLRSRLRAARGLHSLMAFACLLTALVGSATRNAAADETAIASRPIAPGSFRGDLRELPTARSSAPGDPVVEGPRRRITHEVTAPVAKPAGARDPLLSVQRSSRAAVSRAFSTPDVNRDGIGNTGVVPPDTIGDVGVDHYVQAINGSNGTDVLVLDKTTGTTAAGPFVLSDLFVGGGPCTVGSGDPAVLFDQLAQRWLLAEFPAAGNDLCVYVSKTSNPLSGGWWTYDFPVSEFPDYPKFAVWPDAYYATTNESAPAVYAFDRTAMLAGAPATFQRKTASALSGFGFQAFTPADVDGLGTPPATSPAFMLRHRDDEVHGPGSPNASADFVEVWGFSVDFTTPANTTFSKLADVPAAEFDSTLCGTSSTSCIPQPSTSQQLDPLREIIMNRVQYRNFGAYQTLVGSFVVDVDGTNHAGVRWFELRRTGSGAWSLYQEGTYAPDANHRWLSSVAMDGSGNIALGYSVSGSATFPGIRYNGRKSGDALGTLTTGETTVQAGSDSQTNERWGDYSAMSVDPVDNCRFWYTNEYLPSGGLWETRIASFRFDAPDCVDSSGAACGNNVLEIGEDCDGTDDAACAGECDGSCSCPPPVCGNNVTEIGEDCDGTDDAACPGSCDVSCACPVTCDATDLYIPTARSDAKVYRWKIEVDNGDGSYSGFDPSNGVELVVTQGLNQVTTTIPALVGWDKSKPARGTYVWRGDSGGVTKVKIRDKTSKLGILRVQVQGKAVPGAETLDIVQFYADVQLTMDGRCGGGIY